MNQLRKLLGILAVTLLVAIPLHAAPKDKNVTAYLFGFAASFNDSIVYITDIQEVATAYVTKKHNHLVDRSEYSYQLRNYLTEQRPGTHPTAVTYFALNRKKAEKKYAKLKRKYTEKAKGRYIVIYVKPEEFKYQTVAREEK